MDVETTTLSQPQLQECVRLCRPQETRETRAFPTLGVEAQLQALGVAVVAPGSIRLPAGWTTKTWRHMGAPVVLVDDKGEEVARWEGICGHHTCITTGRPGAFVVHGVYVYGDEKEEKTGETKAPTKTKTKKRKGKEEKSEKPAEDTAGGDTKPPRAKRAKVERVTVELPPAVPWQTRPLHSKGMSFLINNRGTVVVREPWVYGGPRSVPFPTSISVRDTPKNMAVVNRLQDFLKKGHTAKARAIGHGRERDMELQFGPTVEDDLKALPAFLAEQQQQKEEEERRERRRVFRTAFDAKRSLELESAAMELMSDRERRIYTTRKAEAIRETLESSMYGW